MPIQRPKKRLAGSFLAHIADGALSLADATLIKKIQLRLLNYSRYAVRNSHVSTIPAEHAMDQSERSGELSGK